MRIHEPVAIGRKADRNRLLIWECGQYQGGQTSEYMSTSVWEQRECLVNRHTIDAHIGGTPLIGLERVGRALPAGVAVFAKAEHLNPGGSVKDRAALAMILDAERRGLWPMSTPDSKAPPPQGSRQLYLRLVKYF